mmetsp:Transcript_503/g.1011  ORF Transcript_503/g.1011 Transcript_503/m.1011 type:complete len:458 (+) Transcript_503:65-1438(+)
MATTAYAVPPPGDRPVDICVFGCTGNAGRAVAHHLLCSIIKIKRGEGKDDPIKVGLAGRSRNKIEQLLAHVGPKGLQSDAEIIIADINDYPSMLKMAQSTKILVCCAGPFGFYGEAAVKACVEAGTHYVDITGEVPWVERMNTEYGAQAEAKGVALLSFSGYDCVPAELSLYLVGKALETKEQRMEKLDLTFVAIGGGIPRGTLATAMGIIGGDLSMETKEGDTPFVPAEFQPALKRYLSPLSLILPKWNAPLNSYTCANYMAAINAPIMCHSSSLLGFDPKITIHDRLISWISPISLPLSFPFSAISFVFCILYVLGMGIGALFLVFPPTKWLFQKYLNMHSYHGNPNTNVRVFARGTGGGGKGNITAESIMTVPGDPGIYSTGVFATAVSLSLLETTASDLTKKMEERPLAGFHPPVAALKGCPKGILVKYLQSLGAEIKVLVTPDGGEMEEKQL